MFSDESGIQGGHGSRTEFVRKNQKNLKNPKRYSTKNTSKLYLSIYIYIYYLVYVIYICIQLIYIQITNRVIARDITIQVWGAIWIGGRSDLVVIKSPLSSISHTNHHHIRKCLIPYVKPAIKRGKFYLLYEWIYIYIYIYI